MSTKSRVQFEVATPRLARIDDLKELLGLETRKDYFDNALTVFEWAVRETRAGRVVGTLEPTSGVFHELVFPTFQTLQADVSDAANQAASVSIAKVAEDSVNIQPASESLPHVRDGVTV